MENEDDFMDQKNKRRREMNSDGLKIMEFDSSNDSRNNMQDSSSDWYGDSEELEGADKIS